MIDYHRSSPLKMFEKIAKYDQVQQASSFSFLVKVIL
jgi:hypothetical protein